MHGKRERLFQKKGKGITRTNTYKWAVNKSKLFCCCFFFPYQQNNEGLDKPFGMQKYNIL